MDRKFFIIFLFLNAEFLKNKRATYVALLCMDLIKIFGDTKRNNLYSM